MKRHILVLVILAVLVFFSAGQAAAEERILSYDVEARVNKDSSLDVTETIVFQVEDVHIRLGFERDFPRFYRMGVEKIATPTHVRSVSRNGAPEPYWVEERGAVTRLFVGPKTDSARNRLKPGTHTYVIKWTGRNHIRGFLGHDELYFNAVGHDWAFPIDKASTRVFLPDGVEVKQAAGYIGVTGSREKNGETLLRSNAVECAAGRPLKVGEGLTVAVGFAKGTLAPANAPNLRSMILGEAVDLCGPFLPLEGVILLLSTLAAGAWYLLVWFFWGRDDPLGPIVPIYEAPAGVSPGLAAALLQVQPRTGFAAVLLSLAAKGCLVIKEKALFVPQIPQELELPEEERTVLKWLGTDRQISLAEYNRTLMQAYSAFSKQCAALYRKYVARNRVLFVIGMCIHLAVLLVLAGGIHLAAPVLALSGLGLFYFPFFFFAQRLQRPGLPRNMTLLFLGGHFLVLGAGMAMLAGADSSFIGTMALVALALAALGMHCLFFRLLGKPRPEATKMLAALEGLRLFLAATEKRRYELMTPDVFEKNLPFALIFGFEKKWLEEFNSLKDYIPEWYQAKAPFDRDVFQCFSHTLDKARTKPSSSASGSWSGSSGGGFSGSSGGGWSGGGSGGGGGRGR